MTRRLPRRRGYALVLVFVFVVLFLGMLGVAWRRTASALRVTSVRTVQVQRDEGSFEALALAMRLLETGLPPYSPYVCGTTVNTSTGPRSYTVTFTSDPEDNTKWSVHSDVTQEGEDPDPMPDTFAPPHA